jgi:hypothetical protein
MARVFSSAGAAVAEADWVRAASVAGITAVILFLVLTAVGFALLFARRRAGADQGLAALQRQANILLVRVDDAIKSSEDELGFAIAQFGEGRTREFSAAITGAKHKLAEAFALQQRLDDAVPDSATQTRDWNARIIQLCESARDSLAVYQEQFDGLRRLERNAPENLEAVRQAIVTTTARLAAAERTAGELKDAYEATAIASVDDNLVRARQLLTEATGRADAAAAGMEGDRAGGTADLIRDAEERVGGAARLLEAIDTVADTLRTAARAVGELLTSTRASAAEAKAVRDAAGDPESAGALNEAVGQVGRVLGKLSGTREHTDPVAELNLLREANATLDTALASARNQQRRLDAARTALTGALVAARSQITTTADFIDTRRGGIGSEARTRLAEARRLLTVAEAEADPVTALDTARRSATYSRDADALARYDVMGQARLR